MDKKKWIKLKMVPVYFSGMNFFDAIPIKQFEKKNKTFYEKFIRYKKKRSSRIFFKKGI